ncbi:GNAT family N-acetyltransferase [Arthrobacter sp. Helios]|uniref:GNAT family N-acetyltransferase n=1 Tax=Arthrobacter sp. Helios TaxID=2828862 RepID=UPI00206539FE|nr:GNAT family N-acetyltransferase [Arthrobacter sp. Helios]UPO78626.1 GNAT family N-acetyltransferase [Arthrobacter sp. Helios]
MPALRTATEADLAVLPALEAASDTLLASAPGVRGSELHRLPPPAGTAELAAARQVLVIGEPIAGFARIEEVEGFAHLEQLSVRPAAAGAGLGRLLVSAALEWAQTHGYPGMTLCTFADVPFNAPFYRSCGFEVIEPQGELAQLRLHEAELGLDEAGRRVAMRVRF